MKCKKCRHFYMVMVTKKGYNPYPCCRLLEDEGKHPEPLTQACFEPRRKSNTTMKEGGVKMARKKEYPGGFRLTLATARRLAVQEFGSAKGLEPDRGTCLEGYFRMELGNLAVSINPDTGMSGCIVVRASLCTASHTCIGYFNRETLEPDYDVMDKYERREKREALETWVGDIGPDACHKLVDEVWNRGR